MPTLKYLIEIDYDPGEAKRGRDAYGWKILALSTGRQIGQSRGLYLNRESARDGAKSWAWGHAYIEHNEYVEIV